MLIVVQGGSATGKTTLSRKLSKDLGIGILAKDDIKELLFDRLGVPENVDRSIMYGTAAMRALFAVLDEWLKADPKRHLIVESAFFADYADKDFQDIEEKYNPGLLQLYTKAAVDERKQRYEARVDDGSRHEGHRDYERQDMLEEQYNERYRAIAIRRTIEIDTTHFDDNDYATLLRRVREEMNEATN